MRQYLHCDRKLTHERMHGGIVTFDQVAVVVADVRVRAMCERACKGQR
jgi:hypothetical protein